MDNLLSVIARLRDEKAWLDDNLERLSRFIRDETFPSISKPQRDLMMEQARTMEQYSFQLRDRINLLKREVNKDEMPQDKQRY